MHCRTRRSLVAFATLLSLAAGCTSRLKTNTARTATQQVLGTEAMDRALTKLQWPALHGRSVIVKVFSTADPLDQDYLRGAAEAILAEHGARIVHDAKDAEFILTLLAGSLGTDQTEVLFGTPRLETLFATVPELPLYKSDTQEGFAKVSYVLQDAVNGGFVYRAGPAQASTYARTWRILLYGKYETDTTRYEKDLSGGGPVPAVSPTPAKE